MPASLGTIRAAIAGALSTNINGLRASDWQPGSIEPPVAIVGWPQRIDYDQTMGRGADLMTIRVRVFVGQADQRAANDLLETYLAKTGAGSVKAAIELDRTLGGTVQDVRVAAMLGAGEVDIGNIIYVSADFELTILV